MNPQFSQPKGSVSKETNKDSIARKFGCKKSEVLYAKPGSTLTGYKVIYDKVSQRSYALPSNLPAGATITSLTDGILVHNTGTVDLGVLAVLRKEFVTLVENFDSGFTIRVRNEVVSDGTSLYRWGGTLPKSVNAGGTIANTGGLSSSNWVKLDPDALRDELYSGFYRLTVIDPSMSQSLIQTKLSQGGTFQFLPGNYTVTGQALAFYPNSEIYAHSGALFLAGENNVGVLTIDPSRSGGNAVRNCKLHNIRISLNGKTGCVAFRAKYWRNHGHLDMMWVDMGTAINNIGIEIGTLCYGLKIDGCEVIGGGAGSSRLIVQNGANAIVITGFDGYSGAPEVDMPDYGIIVRHSTDGGTSWDYTTTFPTEAVCFVNGFSQNTTKYGFLDQAKGTKVYGMYYENNSISDVRISGSQDATFRDCTHSSPSQGTLAHGYSITNSTNSLIDEPIWGTRAGGFFDIGGAQDAGVTGHIVNIARWGASRGIDDLGVVTACKLSRGKLPLQLTTDSVDINSGYGCYRRNVSSGSNIAFTGTPYDGMELTFLLRGSNIASLSIAGVPVDVTGANTATTKMNLVKMVYSKVTSTWVINAGQWNASA